VSIRFGLLALLGDGPKYGFQLKKEFEDTTADMWRLNVGQVYTTLGRLVRDGLVTEEGDGQRARGSGEHGPEDAQRSYRLTSRGREELAEWFSAPRRNETPDRDELTIKVAMALSTPGIDVVALIGAQRVEATGALQQLTRRKARLDPDDLSQVAVLDAASTRLEAELRWLDLVEARVAERDSGRSPEHGQRHGRRNERG
jgi:DNA-binding PadR family transcriptional regulator